MQQRWLDRKATILSAHWNSDFSDDSEKRIARARKDYDYFVKTYFPHLALCENGKFQIDAAKYLKLHSNTRAVFEWARGHAKSSHLSLMIPLWLKMQERRELNVFVLVSKNEKVATMLLSDLQAELEFNELYKLDFGDQMKMGDWAEGNFKTNDGCFFVAVGRGQTPRGLKNRGQRPNYIVIDDLDDDEMVLNPDRIDKAFEWCLTALLGTMAAGRGRFVMVGNRIGKDSVLGRMAERPGIHHTQINAVDKVGDPSWPENYTKKEFAELRAFMGERKFQKEYMNNPISEGAIFMRKHINYGAILPLKDYRMLICYTDPSFKNSKTSDYKATVLVGKTKSGAFHVIKANVDQTSISAMIQWHYDIQTWVNDRVAVMYYMESNFLQSLLLDEFAKVGAATGHHIPIRGDARKKRDKFERIEAMQPLFERGLVLFNEAEKNTQGMNVLEEQLLMFQRGSRGHDDAPDALEGAIFLLTKRTAVATPYRAGKRERRQY